MAIQKERRGPSAAKDGERGGGRGGDRGERGGGGDRGDRGGSGRKKVCRFIADPELKADYKEPSVLKLFLTERAKLVPRRINGNTAKWQRRVATEVKRARILGFLPFTVGQD